jgi:heme-degrading monooxygenase HmoA
MTAYNIVRMRVKPGFEKQFITHHDTLLDGASTDLKAAGLHRFSLVKTGERDFCVLGEWDDFESIVRARPVMIHSLDGLRSMLEDLGDGLGVTDPVSGAVVAEYAV